MNNKTSTKSTKQDKSPPVPFIKEVRIDVDAIEEDWLRNLPVLRHFSILALPSPVTFLMGENGSGKSTLIEAIAICAGFNPEGGSQNFCFSTEDTHAPLWKHTTLVRNPVGKWKDGYFLRAESFYNVASNIAELDRQPAMSRKIIESYGGRSLHAQSHGESFLALMQNRFSGRGLYILDEPEAALSPTRQLTLLSIIQNLVENGSQCILSTHSPILSAYPGATIYEITDSGIVNRPWCETEAVVVTKRFLKDPDSILTQLF